ncbi:MAG: GNAT family N-acetyltransferase, partial [Chloroflexi bacterium]|nr:GNAT family N-acetyltransferase [Chloroflexota bacterium]
GERVSYVDLDLDLDMNNDWQVKLLDEDEFAENAERYGYPDSIRERVRNTVRDVRHSIDGRAWPFATSTESERLRLRPFFWSDLAHIDRWRGEYSPFDDPWIIPAPNSYERHDWFASYLQTPVCRLYAIETCEGEMIGHISLREISPHTQARLGVGLAPQRTGNGYGTEALSAFLPYYFGVLGFERMVLDVAATNLRAIRSYEKIGFRRYGEHYRGAGDESQWTVLRQPQFAKLRGFFQRTAWGLQQLHYDMQFTREMWRAQNKL